MWGALVGRILHQSKVAALGISIALTQPYLGNVYGSGAASGAQPTTLELTEGKKLPVEKRYNVDLAGRYSDGQLESVETALRAVHKKYPGVLKDTLVIKNVYAESDESGKAFYAHGYLPLIKLFPLKIEKTETHNFASTLAHEIGHIAHYKCVDLNSRRIFASDKIEMPAKTAAGEGGEYPSLLKAPTPSTETMVYRQGEDVAQSFTKYLGLNVPQRLELPEGGWLREAELPAIDFTKRDWCARLVGK